MRNLGGDIRFAVRRLWGAPIFTIFAVVTLALGVGMTTGVYAVVHAVAFKDPAIPDVGRVINLYHSASSGGGRESFAWLDYQDLKTGQSNFEAVAGWTRLSNAIETPSGTRPFIGEFVDGDYFDVLRATPVHGRLIQPADDHPASDPVTVLSHDFWQSAFGGDRTVVGETVRIGGQPFTVVGVAGQDVRGVDMPSTRSPALWIPIRLRMRLAQPGFTSFRDENDRDTRFVRVVARLRADRDLDQAAAEVRQIGEALDMAAPIGADVDPGARSTYRNSRGWIARPLTDVVIHESMTRVAGPVITTVLVALGLVLLVACTNLANLLLARGSARRQELAVRLALGASRWRLIREHIVECTLLSLAGGLLGVLIAKALTIMLAADFSMGDGIQMVISVRPTLDAPVLAMAFAATVMAMLIFGVVPAWASTRGDVRAVLGTDTAGGALPRWRGRRILIAVQVTVCVALLAVAAVSAGNAVRLSGHDTGMALDSLAFVSTEPALAQIDGDRALATLMRVRDRVNQRTDVVATSVASGQPLGYTSYVYASAAGGQQTGLRRVTVSGGYLATVGIALRSGRDLDDDDGPGREPVIVLSEAAAIELFDSANVLGRQVTFTRQIMVGEPPSPTTVATVVGVAADVSDGVRPPEGLVYLPAGQHPMRTPTLIARTDGDPADLSGVLRAAVVEADRQLPITVVSTGESVLGGGTMMLRIVAGTAGILGGFAFGLALIGLYGVLSFLVARRTREIGVRIALGANRSVVRRMVVLDGLRPVIGGLLVGGGLAALVLLNPLAESMLNTRDAGMGYAWFAPLLMLLAALVAAYLPARRASKVDPTVALREH
jgi:predicted permease